MLDWRERTFGIVLGVVIGVGVVVAFVFFLSEQTVDAPSLSANGAATGRNGGASQAPSRDRRHPARPKRRHESSPRSPAPVATVRIDSGAPPPQGPAELHYAQGDPIRLSVVSDETVEVELTGYGLTRTVPAGEPTRIDIRATQAGAFALIVADSHIDVARVTVGTYSG